MGLWNKRFADLTVGDYTKLSFIYPTIIGGVVMGAFKVWEKIEEKRLLQDLEKLTTKV